MTNIEPGWYKDPADPTTQRYWDGEGWIGAAIPADATPPAGPPPEESAPETPAGTPPGAARPTGGTPQPGVAVPPAGGVAMPPGAGPPPTTPGTRPGIVLPPGAWPGGQLPPAVLYRIPGLHPPAPRPHGYALAPVSARFVARVIDILVVLALNAVVNGWFVVQFARELGPVIADVQRRLVEGESTSNLETPARLGWLEVTILLVAMALWFAYEVPAIANTGQTLGKRLMHIRVVRVESQDPIGIRRAWRRWNPLGLPVMLWGCYGFGLLLQAADLMIGVVDRPLHLAMHDRSAGTVVIVAEPERPQSDPPTAHPDGAAK